MAETHWTIWLLYGVLVGWVMPVARHEDVAAYLLAAWAAGEVTVQLSGDLLPTSIYFLFDAIVVCAIITDRRILPRLILLLYPVAWAVYALVETPRTQWFCLWGITLVQFILAGAQGRVRGRTHGLGAMDERQGTLPGRDSHSVPIDLFAPETVVDCAVVGQYRSNAQTGGTTR